MANPRYRPNRPAINAARLRRGLTAEKLRGKGFSYKTVKKLTDDAMPLDQSRCYLGTFERLARALDVEDVSSLFMPDEVAAEKPPADHIQVESIIGKNLNALDESADIEELVRAILTIMKARSKVYVFAIEPRGSFGMTMAMSKQDAMSLLYSLPALRQVRLFEVVVPRMTLTQDVVSLLEKGADALLEIPLARLISANVPAVSLTPAQVQASFDLIVDDGVPPHELPSPFMFDLWPLYLRTLHSKGLIRWRLRKDGLHVRPARTQLSREQATTM